MSEYVTIPSLYCFINIILFLQSSTCFPAINKVTPDSNPELRDEIHYPNGTVVGRYSYKDNEGNPIAVKYYADRHSYGVELNSLKTYKVTETSTKKETLQKPKPVNDYMKSMEPLLDLASEVMSFHSKLKVTADANTDKDISKVTQYTQHLEKLGKTGTADYETFYQNEVKAPKQCEKDKVRVYLAKEKRKTRSALEEDHEAKYCERL